MFNHSNNSTEQKPRRPRALPSRFGVPARLLSPSVHTPRPPQGGKAAHITTRGKPPPVIKGGRSISNHVRRKIDISASPRCCSSTQPPPIHRGLCCHYVTCPVQSLRKPVYCTRLLDDREESIDTEGVVDHHANDAHHRRAAVVALRLHKKAKKRETASAK